MPTTKEKTISYAVTGLRLGAKLSTPTGFVQNGAITELAQIEYLREQGYALHECAGIPVFDEAAVILKERSAERVVSKDAGAERARIAGRADDIAHGRVRA